MIRTQFTNRTYVTKYNNETYNFIKSLNPNGMLKDTAKNLGVTYHNLYQTFKIDRVSYSLKKRIEQNFKLTQEQKEKLDSLVLK